MDILPALDLKGGHVVRYVEGDRLSETRYSDDPLQAARAFVAAGARWLHLVDIDRAFHTGAHNDALTAAVCGLTNVHVQVGGNLTDPEAGRAAVQWGAARIVIGTGAALHAERLASMLAAVDVERVAVAIDVREGRVALRGDRFPSSATPRELAARVRDRGVRTVVYRDLSRDGTLGGADLEGAAALTSLGLAVVVAGGVDSLGSLEQARAAGLAGVIVGRALHEGRFTLEEALACS